MTVVVLAIVFFISSFANIPIHQVVTEKVLRVPELLLKKRDRVVRPQTEKIDLKSLYDELQISFALGESDLLPFEVESPVGLEFDEEQVSPVVLPDEGGTSSLSDLDRPNLVTESINDLKSGFIQGSQGDEVSLVNIRGSEGISSIDDLGLAKGGGDLGEDVGLDLEKSLGTDNEGGKGLRVVQGSKGDGKAKDNWNALIAWMKRHRANFSEAMKGFMEYSPGDLTSIIRNFPINSKQYTIFLLCKIELKELYIAILEGNEIVRLVDQGMNEKIQSMKKGSVLINQQRGQVTTVEYSEVSDFLSQAAPYYRIFYYWWKTVKGSVRQS